MTQKPTSMMDVLSTAAGKWIVVVNLIVVMAGGISQYSISQFKQKQMGTQIEKLDKRLTEVESFNYELVIEQLGSIQKTNVTLNEKVEKQSERIDKILEILIKK